MFYLASRGYRCIAHDRRGHGRSSQPWNGNDMDTYADDLAALVTALDLTKAIHVGHSTGGGEVTRYIGRHGTQRVAKAVLIGAVPPLMLKTAAHPGGLPIDAFNQIRDGVLADRSQFFKDLSMPFYGYNRPGAKISRRVVLLRSASGFCIVRTDSTEDDSTCRPCPPAAIVPIAARFAPRRSRGARRIQNDAKIGQRGIARSSARYEACRTGGRPERKAVDALLSISAMSD
jgi:pimeloyl-ACP methyl ester carboxylesterase